MLHGFCCVQVESDGEARGQEGKSMAMVGASFGALVVRMRLPLCSSLLPVSLPGHALAWRLLSACLLVGLYLGLGLFLDLLLSVFSRMLSSLLLSFHCRCAFCSVYLAPTTSAFACLCCPLQQKEAHPAFLRR